MAQSCVSQKCNMDLSSVITRLCILGELQGPDGDNVIKTAKSLNLRVAKSDTADEYQKENGVLFITDKFQGEAFEKLRLSSHGILGPVAFLQIIQKFGKIPTKSTQPLYCLVLFQKKICITGFKKQHMMHLKNLINFMGGIVKPAIKNDVAFLVTNSTNSEQYKAATEIGIPIRRTQWALDLWERRNEFSLCVSDPAFETLTVTDLSVVHICFYGFGKEETLKLEDQARSLGISVVEFSSELCTHIVLNPERTPVKPLPQESPESSCSVVVLQWFTLLCRMKIPVSVDNYRFIRPENLKKRNSGSLKRRFSRPRSCSQSEPAHENLEFALTSALKPNEAISKSDGENADEDDEIPTKTCRVQSFVETVPTLQPEQSQLNQVIKQNENVSSDKLGKMCQRRKFKCIELYETEKNYVDILNAINKIFKLPLEQAIVDKRPVISEQDIKVIFQKFSPILKVHERVLLDLEPIIKDWKDECMIGNIFVKYNSELTKAYPQFINYMDVILQTIEDFYNSNTDFQRFLKEAESNPACQRQGLKDLIVWPMQRIGRLILLLQGILKDTTSDHLDFQPLKTAIQMMEDCGRLVNEDKRKTESIVNKLEMFYEIQNCPHEFLKIKKFFIAKYVVQEEGETTFRKPATVVLLLFKEFLEICKQRGNRISGLLNHKKLPYKHISLLPLDTIKSVALVNSPKEHINKFAIMVQPVSEAAYRSIYSVQSGTAEELVHNLSIVTAKHTLKSVDEIRKNLSYTQVLNFFTSKDTPKKAPSTQVAAESQSVNSSKLETPEKGKSSLFVFRTPEKYVENDKSPSSKSLPPSNKKGKLRRAFSSFLTPIQNIVTPTSPSSELKSGIASTSTTSLDVAAATAEESTTPKVRRKLKSNSFGAKSTLSGFKLI